MSFWTAQACGRCELKKSEMSMMHTPQIVQTKAPSFKMSSKSITIRGSQLQAVYAEWQESRGGGVVVECDGRDEGKDRGNGQREVGQSRRIAIAMAAAMRAPALVSVIWSSSGAPDSFMSTSLCLRSPIFTVSVRRIRFAGTNSTPA